MPEWPGEGLVPSLGLGCSHPATTPPHLHGERRPAVQPYQHNSPTLTAHKAQVPCWAVNCDGKRSHYQALAVRCHVTTCGIWVFYKGHSCSITLGFNCLCPVAVWKIRSNLPGYIFLPALTLVKFPISPLKNALASLGKGEVGPGPTISFCRQVAPPCGVSAEIQLYQHRRFAQHGIKLLPSDCELQTPGTSRSN